MKQKQVIGNWKMHGSLAHAKEFLGTLLPTLPKEGVAVKIAVPYPLIFPIVQQLKGSTVVEVGAQNMHEEEKGAFTGEVSPNLLLDVGARFVLLGHSERRTLFHETDALIQKKVQKALEMKLSVVLCIGESLEEREGGLVEKTLERQIVKALQGVKEEEMKEVTLAYEPVWAIGTGKSATPAMAEDAHKFCRTVIERLYGAAVAEEVTILYGGSVKGENAAALFAEENIDGALVGGASLKPESFLQIIQPS